MPRLRDALDRPRHETRAFTACARAQRLRRRAASNAGGSLWYGNVKDTQELAKDAFDAIDNQVVFGP